MFPGQVVKTGLTLPKVIGGISKTLNVANQIIPLYMQAKPMIKNAKNAFTIAKEIMATPNSNKSSTSTATPKAKATVPKVEQKKEEISTNTSSNNPVFFL